MPDLTTSALLAIIAPHRDMLREMGWGLQRIADKCDSLVYVVRYFEHGVSHCDVDTALAARILCDVVTEWLWDWAYKADAISQEIACYQLNGTWTAFTYAPYGDSHATSPEFVNPTRLAALLALAAWCRKERGG